MPALPTLRQFEYLLALSKTLNFTQAAADTFVTQSTLSAGIQALEEVLGAQLVERDRSKVMLTPVGGEVVVRAEAILAATRDCAAMAAVDGDPLAGEVCIGAIPTIAPFLLPALLRDLRQRFPRLRLRVREDRSADLLARLHDGSVDFGILALPFETADLAVSPLYDEALWLVVPPDTPVSARPPITAFADADLLLLEEGHCLRDHTLAACPADSTGRRVEASSLYTLLQMVSEGWGWAMLPEMAVQGGVLQPLGLEARRFAAPEPRRQIALVSRRTTPRTAIRDALSAWRPRIGEPA